MSDEIIFYANPKSRARMVRWMLEEVGRPYKTEIIEFGQKMKTPEYLKINPMGKVPALRHGDVVVTETAAICAYLADAFPETRLAPASGTKLRAPYYRWLFFAAGPIEASVSNRSLGFVVPKERQGMMGYGSSLDALNVLEATLAKNAFLVGESFTAADLYVGSHLGFGMHWGTIEKRPVFEEYWSRISDRPAARRARKIDDELIARM